VCRRRSTVCREQEFLKETGRCEKVLAAARSCVAAPRTLEHDRWDGRIRRHGRFGITAVLCSLCTETDDPTPMARTLTIWFVVAFPLSVILPAIDGCVSLGEIP
jgi:hypothetical protein